MGNPTGGISDITVRRAVGSDLALLQDVGRTTFYETFAAVNTAEDMRKYLDEAFSSERLQAELSDIDAEFYLALIDNEVSAYLKVNFGRSQTEIREDRSVEIERIYVLKKYQGRKVGQTLFEKALALARQRNAEFVWLGVWEKNYKAIDFYRRNGFVAFDQHVFRLGDDEQTDIMMKLMLNT